MEYFPGTASLISEIDSKKDTFSAFNFKWTLYEFNYYIKTCETFEFVIKIQHKFTFKLLSEKLIVVLRDGRTLIGYLRSIDQFGVNFIFLKNTISHNFKTLQI